MKKQDQIKFLMNLSVSFFNVRRKRGVCHYIDYGRRPNSRRLYIDIQQDTRNNSRINSPFTSFFCKTVRHLERYESSNLTADKEHIVHLKKRYSLYRSWYILLLIEDIKTPLWD